MSSLKSLLLLTTVGCFYAKSDDVAACRVVCIGSNKELLNSSLTACVNLFYVGKNVLNDKATMSKNKYVNL